MSYLDRVLADSTDREDWLHMRDGRIGASDAAKLSKAASVDLYADAKVKPSEFSGNHTTRNGNRWEPMLLAWVGIPQNTLLIHHPDNERFVATPDGITPDGRRLAEIKTKHNKVIVKPTPAELRQVAWQLFVVPEAESCDWAWGEVVGQGEDWELRDDSPKKITYSRTDQLIVGIQNHIVPIATAVLAEMDRRLALQKEAGF